MIPYVAYLQIAMIHCLDKLEVATNYAITSVCY